MFHTHPRALGTGLATALTLAVTAAPAALAQPIDLRSPDARDAGEARTTVVPTRGGVNKVQTANPSGFDWGDAATGAGVVLTVLLAATGGMIAVRRIRRPHAAAAPKA